MVWYKIQDAKKQKYNIKLKLTEGISPDCTIL